MGHPDFLCIGARKAGTTWLHENLSQHPEVWLPLQKELHYFDHRPPWLVERLFGRASHLRHARWNLRDAALSLGRGGSLAELSWAARVCLLPRNDAWYQSLFPDDDARVKGEVCPGYARMGDAAVASVASLVPGVKLVYLVRDPIDCAWSSATSHFFKKAGGVGVERTAPEEIEDYLCKENSVRHLRYAENLEVWERHFPVEQILVSCYEDLRSDPRSVFKRVCRFIGVSDADSVVPEGVEARRGGRVKVRGEVPERYRRLLARLHLEGLEKLAARGRVPHSARWLADARAALA